MPYEPTITFAELTWTHNPEGAQGEYSAVYRGRRLTIFCGLSGKGWCYAIDGREARFADPDSRGDAMKDAMNEADRV